MVEAHVEAIVDTPALSSANDCGARGVFGVYMWRLGMSERPLSFPLANTRYTDGFGPVVGIMDLSGRLRCGAK